MLKGSLCTVRHVVSNDLNTYIALLNDLPSRGHYYSSQFQSPEAIRKEFMLNGFATDDRETFVIEDKAGQLVGLIGHFKGRTALCREIGYRLFQPALAGRGFISQASMLLRDYLFRAYAFNRLELLMDPENLASERIAQKCGFSYEGTMRGAFCINGQLRDTKVYSLLRAEWEALPAAPDVAKRAHL
jgi:[ribosomal protein S5]-alanine N-acetyltransferase